MRHRFAVLCAVAVCLAAFTGCNALMGGGANQDDKRRDATIVIWRVGDECSVRTNPPSLEAHFKNKVKWTVIDVSSDKICTSGSGDVEIKWKAGSTDPFTDSACSTKKFKDELECKIKDATQTPARYDVYLGGVRKEDPEIQIVQ